VSTLTRYWLLQIPGWILLIVILAASNEWFGLPAWMGLLIFLLWVVKDALLYPILKRGYESATPAGTQRLVSLTGVAKQDLNPEGFVLVNGELWKAVADPADDLIEAGEQVQVKSAEGMLLTVSRLTDLPVTGPKIFRSRNV
jgi:membrane protein implicated in regulation of membrane protease activity